jgi:lytic murein transglycosylase
MTLRPLLTSLALLAPLPALAQTCGGPFGSFVQGLQQEAIANGHAAAQVKAFFASASYTQSVIDADRKQGVFQLDFTSFSRRLISQNRLDNGARKARQYSDTFARIQSGYGVPPGILLAFWAFETDYGGFQGDFNTLNALVTLAHDCRRPELFRPQIFAALKLYEQGDFSPTATTGAWAGEIGMVQMLPGDILENGVDGDGDGHVRLKTSAPDALMSGGKMLRGLGWAANQPWLQEITLPAEMDWSQTGLRTTQTPAQWQSLGVQPRSGQWQSANLPASIILPQGRHGPAFLAYPNFSTLFEWNQSFTYVLTAAYFATRLSGAPLFDPRTPDTGLTGPQLKSLQQKLQAKGFDVGGADGILGEKSREAVQTVQQQLGLPADAWPTPELLNRL